MTDAIPGPPAGTPVEASIEIRDGGPGFADGDLAVAFERGALSRRYQGARKVGSGLGLALAARMARQLGAGSRRRTHRRAGRDSR